VHRYHTPNRPICRPDSIARQPALRLSIATGTSLVWQASRKVRDSTPVIGVIPALAGLAPWFSKTAEEQPASRHHYYIRSVRCPRIKGDGRQAGVRYHCGSRLAIPLCNKAHQPALALSVSGSDSLDWRAGSFYLIFHHLHEDRLRILHCVQSVVPCHPQVFQQQLGSQQPPVVVASPVRVVRM
jgi:hypothetical protein